MKKQSGLYFSRADHKRFIIERWRCTSGSSTIRVLFFGTQSTCATKYRTARSPSLIWVELYEIKSSPWDRSAENFASSTFSCRWGNTSSHTRINLSIAVRGGVGIFEWFLIAFLYWFTNFSLSLFFSAINAAKTLSKSSISLVVYSFPQFHRYPLPFWFALLSVLRCRNKAGS